MATNQNDRDADAIAGQLARFAAGLTYDDLPDDVVDHAKTLVLDQLACVLIGSTMPWVIPALRLVELTQGAKAESTVANYGVRVLAADAAFANATFGQACELDDSAYGSAGHIGTATVPVALAVGEREKIDGRRFIVSIVAGYEIMYRLMRAIRPHHNARGFHSQSIGGPFAAAATAGKILNLDEERMTHALAIAGSHAGGPLEYDQSGGEVKRIHAGLAARGGIQSALLAQFGLTGPSTIIEGKRGFCNIFATQSDQSQIASGLGEIFHIHNAVFKMYPAIGGVHTAIAAVESLVRRHGIAAADIVRIRVGLPEKVLLHGAGIRRPHDVIGAQFSLAFSLALAICKKDNGLAQYRDAANWNDFEMGTIMDRVEAYNDPAAHGPFDHMASVAIDLKDGRTVEAVEKYVKGSPRNPASQEDLDAKVRSLAAAVLPASRVEALIGAVRELERADNVAEIAQLLVRNTGGR